MPVCTGTKPQGTRNTCYVKSLLFIKCNPDRTNGEILMKIINEIIKSENFTVFYFSA